MTDEPGWDGPLPAAVRKVVVAVASDTLGGLADDEVPVSLRPFRRWAPVQRTRRATSPLAAALDADPTFRQRVAATARERMPDVAAALDAGSVPAAADPVEVAALAYLVRTPGWSGLLAAAQADLDRGSAAAAASSAADEVARLHRALADERDQNRAELTRLRAEVAAVRAEAVALDREVRAAKAARRRADAAAGEAAERAARLEGELTTSASAADAELRRARARLTAAESALEAVGRASREGRGVADIRLRLLLDTVVEAATGLRRELALPPVTGRPADLVEAEQAGQPQSSERALLSDDPALLDQLLALPQAHLVVDGYNVTKTGFPELPLEGQRTRLVTGLSALAARSGAEVTCCFDGATLQGRVPAMNARGVRVLFSRAGETADELIRRLVRAEPPGRAVTVVSSDREVADGIRRSGARPVSATALVRRLDRG